MGNLQDIDRNNSEWHQVLDRDNDEPSWKNFPLSFYPLGTPGPINCIPSMPMPHEFVMLLADEFTHLLVQKTNSHGDAKHLSKSGDENVNLGRKKWKHKTREEFLAFLGTMLIWSLSGKVVCLNIGQKLISHNIHHKFSTVFTRDRFFQLQTTVRFPQIEGDSSKLQKVPAVVQHFSQQFQEYYVSEQQVSINKSFIGFEGRGPAIQYMPNKHHHRFRFKLFCLCESSTGYTCSFSI